LYWYYKLNFPFHCAILSTKVQQLRNKNHHLLKRGTAFGKGGPILAAKSCLGGPNLAAKSGPGGPLLTTAENLASIMGNFVPPGLRHPVQKYPSCRNTWVNYAKGILAHRGEPLGELARHPLPYT